MCFNQILEQLKSVYLQHNTSRLTFIGHTAIVIIHNYKVVDALYNITHVDNYHSVFVYIIGHIISNQTSISFPYIIIVNVSL